MKVELFRHEPECFYAADRAATTTDTSVMVTL